VGVKKHYGKEIREKRRGTPLKGSDRSIGSNITSEIRSIRRPSSRVKNRGGSGTSKDREGGRRGVPCDRHQTDPKANRCHREKGRSRGDGQVDTIRRVSEKEKKQRKRMEEIAKGWLSLRMPRKSCALKLATWKGEVGVETGKEAQTPRGGDHLVEETLKTKGRREKRIKVSPLEPCPIELQRTYPSLSERWN